MKIAELIDSVSDQFEKTGGMKNVYFIACGGSYAGFYPAHYLLSQESINLKSSMLTSNEFVYAPPRDCGKNSLVITCSMRGTPETIEAARVAKRLGARTIALYVEESELSGLCDYAYQYNSIANDSSRVEEVNSTLALQMAFELLKHYDQYAYYDQAQAAFAIVDDIYRKAVGYTRKRAKIFARECKQEDTIYVMGSGPSMGAAYIFSICNLMEMQWVHSPTVNSGEFFHGPFEVVDKNLPIFLLISEGRTRPVDLRALDFLKKYGEKLYVIDAKELGINRINDSVCEYFNHIIFASVLNNVYLRELSQAKQHPYTNRRYMWKVSY